MIEGSENNMRDNGLRDGEKYDRDINAAKNILQYAEIAFQQETLNSIIGQSIDC